MKYRDVKVVRWHRWHQWQQWHQWPVLIDLVSVDLSTRWLRDLQHSWHWSRGWHCQHPCRGGGERELRWGFKRFLEIIWVISGHCQTPRWLWHHGKTSSSLSTTSFLERNQYVNFLSKLNYVVNISEDSNKTHKQNQIYIRMEKFVFYIWNCSGSGWSLALSIKTLMNEKP